MSSVDLRRGRELLIENANLAMVKGQKVGLTGANGCGKSSLFLLLLNQLEADGGRVSVPADWVVSHVAQEISDRDRVALEFVIDGDEELREVETDLIKAEKDNNANRIAECHARLQEIEGYQATSRAAKLLSGLGFQDSEIQLPLREFSGGWQMRLALARALMARSDLLLLDEPTNHLDLETVVWLESWLKQYKGLLILISHDREFLDGCVDSILSIERRQLSLYKGNYSAFEKQRVEKLAQQQSAYLRQQQSIQQMQSFITRFKAKASKAKQAQSRLKSLEKMELISPAHVDSPFRFEFLKSKKSPGFLMKLESVSAGYGQTVVVDDVNLTLLSQQRIGLLGVNGAGKSTLIKTIAKQQGILAGDIEQNPDLKIGYFAQHQLDLLDMDASPLLHLKRQDHKATDKELRAFLGGFDFSGDKAIEPVGPFSGGEKARLVLALLIWSQPNLLLLDEPTNHLDLEMRYALNKALQGFEGTVILVSHDRYLINTVCDELLVIHNGKLSPFSRSVEDYPHWLNEQNQEKKAGVGCQSGGKKTLKQQAAIIRQSVSPLKKRLKRVEREMEKLQLSQSEMESRLADNTIYDEANKSDLNDLIFSQAENKKALQSLEDEWYQLSEEIEQLSH